MLNEYDEKYAVTYAVVDFLIGEKLAAVGKADDAAKVEKVVASELENKKHHLVCSIGNRKFSDCIYFGGWFIGQFTRHIYRMKEQYYLCQCISYYREKYYFKRGDYNSVLNLLFFYPKRTCLYPKKRLYWEKEEKLGRKEIPNASI